MRLACFMVLAFVAPVVARVDESGTFAYYQIILDRMPFGDTRAQVAAAAPAPANPNQPPLAAALRLVALEADDDSGAIRAGIVDGPGQKNVYLSVGQEEHGIRLVEADFPGDRALVRKGDQEEWLTLGERGGGAAAPALSSELEERRAAFLRSREARRVPMSLPARPANVHTNGAMSRIQGLRVLPRPP